jgi:hypothetical protein
LTGGLTVSRAAPGRFNHFWRNAMAPLKIQSLYCRIATEHDGSEGIPAMTLKIAGTPHMMPILGGDTDRIDSMTPQVRRIQAETGAAMRLARFDLAEEIATLADFQPGRSGRKAG